MQLKFTNDYFNKRLLFLCSCKMQLVQLFSLTFFTPDLMIKVNVNFLLLHLKFLMVDQTLELQCCLLFYVQSSWIDIFINSAVIWHSEISTCFCLITTSTQLRYLLFVMTLSFKRNSIQCFFLDENYQKRIIKIGVGCSSKVFEILYSHANDIRKYYINALVKIKPLYLNHLLKIF